MNQRVVVIGGGLAGLATAALAAEQGYQVILLEKNAQLGGRARVFKASGFTFDMGPSWYTMPELFERYFRLLGVRVDEQLKLQRLDPIFKVYFEGGKNFTVQDRPAQQQKLFDEFEPHGGQRLERHLHTAAERYQLSSELLYRAYSRFQPADLMLAWNIRNSGIFQTLQRELERGFTSIEARQLLGFGSVFLGGQPGNMAGLFSLLNHAIFRQGVYYPMGGMGTLVSVLERHCKKRGVTIKTGEAVTRFAYGRSVAGSRPIINYVITERGVYGCDVVISGADYWFTETKLISPEYASYPEAYWRKKTMSPSAYCLYLGVSGSVKNLEHHTMYFSDAWDEHFTAVFKTKTAAQKPSIYISTPSKTDRTVAPKGCENIFVLVPIAAGLEDTSALRSELAAYVFSVLEKISGVDIRKRVVFQKDYCIADFAADYNSYKGSAFGLSNTLFQTAWFRPRIQSQRIGNLFYCGQNTQPGIGMPMSVISAELLMKLVTEHIQTHG